MTMEINRYTPSLQVFDKNLYGNIGNAYTVRSSDTTANSGNESAAGNVSFRDVLKNALDKVNDKQVQADNSITSYINGDMSLNETIVATEEAELSLQLAIQMRNKLVNVYEEFNKLQV